MLQCLFHGHFEALLREERQVMKYGRLVLSLEVAWGNINTPSPGQLVASSHCIITRSSGEAGSDSKHN